MNEFKKFALKGNMIDLAVGMIIGTAFNGIVKSLVDDIFMPILSLFTGKLDFANWFIALDGNEYASLKAAQEAQAATLNYGMFITAVINFLLMAFVIFCFVKFMNNLAERGKKEEVTEEAPATKVCPYCKSEIPVDATKCAHCTSDVSEATA